MEGRVHYSNYRSDDIGRTGVVMVSENGRVSPLIITIQGKEFVLEIKGCGQKTGGFGEMQFRTGRDIITGGVEREQAMNEFERLSEMTEDDAPKAVASILFNNHGYEQGMILRLSPATVRASYSGCEAYPPIDAPEEVNRVMEIYADELAEHVFSPRPKIMNRSSHTENILVWGQERHLFTDFSDHALFSDPEYPFEETNGGTYVTPRILLGYYIKMVNEIPGYEAKRDQRHFLQSLERAFAQKGFSVSFYGDENADQIAAVLWKGGVAAQVFSARRRDHYRAEGVMEGIRNSLNEDPLRKRLELDFPDAFQQRLAHGFGQLRDAIDLLFRNDSGEHHEELGRIRAFVEEKNLSEVFNHLAGVHAIWTSKPPLVNSDRMTIYNAIFYFNDLDRCLFEPFRTYFHHERDVVESGMAAAPETERPFLEQAKQELDRKFAELEHWTQHPQDAISKIQNHDFLEGFITLQVYQETKRKSS